MISTPSFRVLQPQLDDISVEVKRNFHSADRKARVHSAELSGAMSLDLPFTPTSYQWCEIYVEGVRLVNVDNAYTVTGKRITFKAPVTGRVKVICDTVTCPTGRTIVSFDKYDRIQGTVDRPRLDSKLEIGSVCNLVIITQPLYGYARLSDDQMGVVYVPNTGYIGTDTFSLALLSHMGQESVIRCVYIDVQ
jgi:hypothetical protein